MYEYNIEVLKVVDGDSIRARVDLGCDVRLDMLIRLAHINAPELSCEAGVNARAHLESLIPADRKLILRTIKDRKEKYGRYLGVLYPRAPMDAPSLNDQMVEDGQAVVYEGGKR